MSENLSDTNMTREEVSGMHSEVSGKEAFLLSVRVLPSPRTSVRTRTRFGGLGAAGWFSHLVRRRRAECISKTNVHSFHLLQVGEPH